MQEGLGLGFWEKDLAKTTLSIPYTHPDHHKNRGIRGHVRGMAGGWFLGLGVCALAPAVWGNTWGKAMAPCIQRRSGCRSGRGSGRRKSGGPEILPQGSSTKSPDAWLALLRPSPISLQILLENDHHQFQNTKIQKTGLQGRLSCSLWGDA